MARLAAQLAIFTILMQNVKAQCNGPPTYILPGNSTGYLSFPDVNYDPVGGTWKHVQQYPESVTCTWILIAPPLHVFIVKMMDLSTEENFDFVKLYTSEDRKNVLSYFSGELSEEWQAFTPDDTLVVDFVSDEYTTYHGFHFAFRYMPKACVPGGVSISEPQLIALPPWNLQGVLPGPRRPGFESPVIVPVGSHLGETPKEEMSAIAARWVDIEGYPQDLNCTWHVNVFSKQLVQIDVLKYHTDEDDVLQIYQLEGTDELRPMLKFWSDQISRNQIHSGNPLLLNFVSRSLQQGTGSGFLLNVTYISRGCNSEGQKLDAPKGTIAYPSHNWANGQWLSDAVIYYGEDSCEWRLSAPEGYSFNVTIVSFDTRIQDQLEVLEGTKSLMKHGGTQPLKREILSSGNELLIKFASKTESQKTGFLLMYSWLLRRCQFELNSNEDEFRSPFFPNTYGDDMKCQWKLTPPPGHVTQFLIYRLRLDYGDYLQITDVDGEKNVVFSQDSNSLGLWEFAPSKPVMVNFMSDRSNNKGYFRIKYDTFMPGSCNFSLTSCDYAPVDPLQAWEFKVGEKMIFVDESSLGIQLPRGYRTKLASPIIRSQEDATAILKKGSNASAMCLKLDYVIAGQDAFKLTVSKEELKISVLEDEESNWITRESGSRLSSDTLISLHGPHGDTVLRELVNFTTENPFQIYVTYERGYGPHYRVSINSIAVLNGPCDGADEEQSSFSCIFETSFCGWKNVHTDHRNWQLGKTGVTAMVNDNGGFSWTRKRNKLQKQIADLESPTVTVEDLLDAFGHSDLCLDLSYKIQASLTELKVILVSVKDEASSSRQFFQSSLQEEFEEIWTQGRAKSDSFLKARIPLKIQDLPSKFKVVLRGTTVTSNRQNSGDSSVDEMGVTVQGIDLVSGKCAEMLDCDFTYGFCSWKVESDGNTVWRIQRNPDKLSNNSFAAVYSKDVPDKFTILISPPMSNVKARAISFMYRMQSTTQCLTIGVRTKGVEDHFKILWEQCKSKGNHWLNECVDLPISKKEYQVLIRSHTGQLDSELWVDDIVFSDGRCSHTKMDESPNPVWQCNPLQSLCGMTQPVIGLFDWGFYHLASEDRPSILPPGGSFLQYSSREQDNKVVKEGRQSFHLSTDFIHPANSYSTHDYEQEKDLTVNSLNSLESDHDFAGKSSDEKSAGGAYNERMPEDGEAFASQNHGNGLTCLDGRVLEPSWACDGVPDCDDGSDELACNCGPEGCGNLEEPEVPLSPGICSEGTFRCPSGRNCPIDGCPRDLSPCLPRSFLCDSVIHCIEGEDERSCRGVKREAVYHDYGPEWQSDAPRPKVSKRTEYSDRNGVKPLSMLHSAGEHSGMSKDRFECSGGLFLPKSFRCDGRKDCPLDGLDEVGCFHCEPGYFLCPTSGVCLPKVAVCDGDVSVPSCTDEQFCHGCPAGHFACDVCLPSFKVCDGVWDCNEGEDEQRCLGLPSDKSSSKSLEESRVEEAQFHSGPGISDPYSKNAFGSNCNGNNYKCSEDRCLPLSAVCDRKQDCSKGEDEMNCLDDNKDVELYISAKPSSGPGMHGKGDEIFPSYLITPVLHHKKNAVGLLTFYYRLDAWLGASNATLSVELLDVNSSLTSLIPWTLWRQSGHKGKLWLKAEVVIPEMPNIFSYRLGFLLSNNGIFLNSQQIHLAKISFNMISLEDVRIIALSRSSCEFDGSWCGWTQSYTERGYSWVHAITSPHARRTGPITGFPDEGTSGFIFADSLQGTEGDTTDLMSPPIMLPQESLAICFRFAVFLYGAHVAKLSVNTIQVSHSGHPFTSELFDISGGKGLGWVPVSITVDGTSLQSEEVPFVLVIRATRGNGPEADIALDHVSLLDGRCDGITNINPEIILKPMTSVKFAYVNSLNVGPSFTPFSPSNNLNSSAQGPTKNVSTGGNNLCSLLTSCSECVSSIISECLWCTDAQSCVSESSSFGRSCHTPIWHRSAEVKTAGPAYCPRIVPDHSQRQFVPAGAAIALSFPVTNIPVADIDGLWTCIFELREEITGSKGKADSTSLNEITGNSLEMNDEKKGNRYSDEDEELLKRLKQFAIKKHHQAIHVKVPGHFKGSVFNAAEGLKESMKVGFGAINCGDGEALFSLPQSTLTLEASVQIHSPNGRVIDNTGDNHVIIYRCESLSDNCQSCIKLNSSYSCGWCAYTKSCSTHMKCSTGLWKSHSSSSHSYVCNVQDELDFIKNLLETEEDDQEFVDLEEELFGQELDFATGNSKGKGKVGGGKKKVEKKMKKFLGNERESKFDDEYEDAKYEEEEESNLKGGQKKKNKKNKQGGKEKSPEKGATSKGSMKMGKKGKGRGFLRVPVQPGVFVARNVWRLHTGKQYYIPVTKKTLINLGFVRQVTYGNLSKEKSRTVLVDGAWKKAAGFYIDLFEKADQDPVTSVITTSKKIFEEVLSQLQPEKEEIKESAS